MQEREKKKIVIASVLKPVDETRMFSKLGASLVNDTCEVSIIGFAPAKKQSPTNAPISLYPMGPFPRLSLQRLLAPFHIFLQCLRLRPSVLIVTSHELLVGAVLLRALVGTKIVYDVRENYYLNLLHTNAFPVLVRWPLALYVRSIEYLTSPFIHHFLLAEQVYARQLNFPGTRFTILENKHLPEQHQDVNTQTGFHRLLFTGTLAETTGVFTAIHLTKRLHALDSQIGLTIIGYAAQQECQQRLKREAEMNTFIKLIGVDKHVPHDQIVKEISRADFGFICYPDNGSTRGRIPTKFFEYAALGLRILATPNSALDAKIKELGIGLVIQEAEAETGWLQKMLEIKLPNTSKNEFLWEKEAKALSQVIKSL